MEKNNGKIVAVVALVVAVVSLSVGFAAFAATLTISSTATAKAGTNDFAPDVNYTSGQTVKCYVGGTNSTTELTADTYSGGTAANKT